MTHEFLSGRRIVAGIDCKALRHNFNIARQHADGSNVLAVIKANAYGHGLLPAAEALQDANLYGVTDINEAETLREGGTDKGILILQGLIERSDIARIAHHGFQVVIHRLEDLQWLEEALDASPPPQPLTFWLKLGSGMGRLGLSPQQFPGAYAALQAKPWTRNIVMMTHLANASLPESALNTRQLDCFAEVRKELDTLGLQTSVAASAALLGVPTQADWARPGIMLYGSSPFAWTDTARRREAYDLQAVMSLQARLLSVQDHAAGDNIGYNSQFICPAPMRVGIVSCGYADGYPSNTPNGCPVSVCGKRTTTVGRVSMDMLAVDLSAIEEAQSGMAVELWGKHVSLDEVAAHTGILSYNLTCSVATRVPRVSA